MKVIVQRLAVSVILTISVLLSHWAAGLTGPDPSLI